MTYKPSPECFDAANAASGGKLSKADINDAFEAMAAEKDRLKASGQSDRMAERLTAFAEARAERTRIAAALQKRHAALNILVKDRLQGTIKSLTDQGLKPHQALMAIMEGTQKGVAGGRASVDAMKAAFRGRYVGDMLAQMQREAPHLEAMLMGDAAFDRDVMREMMELRDGGKPGSTGNKDAQYAAKTFATYAEMSRVELNRLGAAIGKLEGWAGAQTHDDTKMIAAGQQAWVDSIISMLDLERSGFTGEAEARDLLPDMYNTIVSGISGKMPERSPGRVNPANMAKSLGRSRVLHFKDADTALAYRDQFGFGNTIKGIIDHQMKAADMAAIMETFGPNPEYMLQSIIDRMKADIRNDPKLTPQQKNDLPKTLSFEAGNIRAAFDIMTGLANRPVNSFWAKFGSETRAVQAMAKLGGAVISSIPADVITTALASQFRGGGFLKGLTATLGGIMHGRPKGEQKEISYLLGEGFEALIGHINAAAAGHDMPLGMMSRLQEKFFKWNGMTWWDSAMRSVATRGVAAEMGMRAGTDFANLPANYRHVLSLHGIDEERWNIIRKAEGRLVDGRNYITGDLMRGLSDDDVKALVAGDLAKADLALAERTADRGAKTAQEQEWVQKRAFKLAGRMGRMEARLEDQLTRMAGKRDADVQALKDKVGAVREKLTQLAEYYDQGNGSERTVARREMSIENRIARTKRMAEAVKRDLTNTLEDIGANLDETIAKHVDAIGKLEDKFAETEGTSRAIAASERYAELQAAIDKAITRVEERKGKLDANGRARLEELSGRLEDLHTSLADTRGSFPITKAQARRVGFDQAKASIAERSIERDIADIQASVDKAGKEKLATMHADWTKREGDLKEFSDRMDRYGKAREAADAADKAGHPERIAAIHDKARFDLEMKIRSFVADETRYGMLQTDARSRRTSTWGGNRPGTFNGEMIRFIMQFKGFPIAFTQRVIGRTLFGYHGQAGIKGFVKGMSAEQGAHIGTLITGLGVAGYMAMTTKDMVKGNWPPRDPMDPKVLLAAFQQGGALGIYGDYLFAQGSRFGNSALETAAGPTIGTASSIINNLLTTRDYAFGKLEGGKSASPAAQWINLLQGNTPFANLAYAKPVLDYFLMNGVKDWATPGHTAKLARQRYKDYGQTTWGAR